jgi:poly-gamma-glutamate synthesis protein (capsule biosynthesis protein)
VTNHAHVIKGMEFYKGVPIYHSLCNLVTVFPYHIHHMFTEEPETTLNKSLLRPRSGYSKVWLDLETPNYPFPKVSRKSMIGKIEVEDKKVVQVGFYPVYIDKEGRPILQTKNDALGQEVHDYMVKVTAGAHLNAAYEWKGDNEIVAFERR